ncbi:MAG: Rrf2 family transcriptional regulator [Planctomycetaceae bacterium]
MISQTAEYALRAIVFLADQDGQPQTTAKISEGTQIPAGYLAKVMQVLNRGGIVNAQRGLYGGFTLIKPSADLTVLEVINAVEPIQRYYECPLKIPHHGPELCPLHRKLDDAAQLLQQSFGESSIASLISVPEARRPLCRMSGRSPTDGVSEESG